jgi:hypothetical protein
MANFFKVEINEELLGQLLLILAATCSAITLHLPEALASHLQEQQLPLRD